MMTTLRITLSAAVLGAVLAGCGSSVKLDEAAPVVDARPNPNTGAGANGARSGAAGQSGVTTVDVGKGDDLVPSDLGRVVYFDFDSYVLRDEYKPLIERHARALAASRTRKIVIEGHTDERGGREYNLALGQRRAEAVAKSMMLLGASDGQIEAVSYGKERPAVDGHDEAAWAKNRRAELKDR